MMKTATLVGLEKLSLIEESIPQISADEVLIKVEAVGICGSDIHYYKHGHIGARKAVYPHIPGHEISGTVVEIGGNVKRFKVGDHVVIEPGIGCKKCEYCKTGRYNLCTEMKFISSPPVNGGLRQYITHPEDLVYSIPEDLPFNIASFAEPISVVIHALNRVNFSPGKKVLITGMGPIGLLTVCAAKYYGASEICVTDMVKSKLEIAKKLGATNTIEVPLEKMPLDEFDVIIESSGAPKAIEGGLASLKRGGKMVSIGFPATPNVPIDLTAMLQREIDLLTVYRYTNTFPLAINLLQNIKDKIGEIITSEFSIDNIETAMKVACEPNSIKVIVNPNQN